MTEYEIITSIISGFALIFSLIGLLNKEDANIMPYGEQINDKNHLSLFFLNTSSFNLHNVFILINCFDNNLLEIEKYKIMDMYNFSIGEKTNFNYGFNSLNNLQTFRIRFSFKYKKFIFFNIRKTQEIWYSRTFINENEFKIVTTHKNEIDEIINKYKESLNKDEKEIDVKFKLNDFNFCG